MLCLTKNEVYCRYTHEHNTLLFSTKYNDAFTPKGYDNMKKPLKIFRLMTPLNQSHTEAKLKWNSSRRPPIVQQLSSESAKQQDSRRNGLLYQLAAIKFLARQGIALRGHVDKEGNLYQLLSVWKNNNAAKNCIINGKNVT